MLTRYRFDDDLGIFVKSSTGPWISASEVDDFMDDLREKIAEEFTALQTENLQLKNRLQLISGVSQLSKETTVGD